MLDQITDTITSTVQDIVHQFGTNWQQLGSLLTVTRYGWIIAFGMEIPLIPTLGSIALVAGLLWEFMNVFTNHGSMGLAAAWAFALGVFTMVLAAGIRACATEVGGIGGLALAAFVFFAGWMWEDFFVSKIADVIR